TPISVRTTRSAVTTSTVSGMDSVSGERAALFDRRVDVPNHVERLLRQPVVLAVEDFLEPANRLADGYVLTGVARKLLGDEERLGQEALDLARARHGELVLVGELVDAEDRDDVLQVLVALEHALHLPGDVVMLLADDARLERPAERSERVH